MNSPIILIYISIISFVLGLIKFRTIDTVGWIWQLKFIEIWNDFINFLVTGLIGYYFVLVRWPLILGGAPLDTSDMFLLVILLLGLFGHLCVLSHNFTEGIKAIVDKYFRG